jgi:hypothetical protein
MHDLKAVRDSLNGWRLRAIVLIQTGHASPVADRTPESLVPFVHHRMEIHSDRGLFQSKKGPSVKFSAGRNRPLANAKQATEQRNTNVGSRTDGAGIGV